MMDHDEQLFCLICELSAVEYALSHGDDPNEYTRYGLGQVVLRNVKRLEAMKDDMNGTRLTPPDDTR